MRAKSVAVPFLLLALTAPGLAGDVFGDTFPGKRCYVRNYGAAHLAGHPRQTVRMIAISYSPKTAEGATNSRSHFEVSILFRLKNNRTWFSSLAECATKDGAFACALESDGGSFTLTPQDGRLRLAVVNRGGTDAKDDQIVVESSTFGGFGKPDGDDLVFDLNPARASACNPTG